MSTLQYSFTTNTGDTVELSQFKDNILLMTNVASYCGFTKHYEWLQSMSKKYSEDGLVVIGFPCNQFGNQEPGTDQDIKEFCEKNYSVDFALSTKIDVNGENAHPLFKHLRNASSLNEVPWNFTKFVSYGNKVISFTPDSNLDELESYIVSLIGNK
jgi:glutathione peroxidase